MRVPSPDAGRSIDQRVRDQARALGFDVVGVARADEPLGADHDRYKAFVEAGKQGEMTWLGDDVEARRRLDGDAILPGAKSVICVGRSYARRPEDEANDPPLARTIARYARGQDYHVFLRKKLRSLASFVRGLAPGTRARPLQDIEPILERAWAARAGLGFVGKNGLVIAPGTGSFLLLGEVVTTLELTPDTPMTERCGACTRCLDACPTRAFDAPFVLDPRRCISYWTIEARGDVPAPIARAMEDHLFGCDDCQDVCPFNKTAPPAPSKTAQFRPLDRWGETSMEALASIDDPAWEALSLGSPVKRASREGIARNAGIVLSNRLVRARRGDGPESQR